MHRLFHAGRRSLCCLICRCTAEPAVLFTHEQVAVIFTFALIGCGKFKTGFLLENHNKVGATEKKVAQHITLFDYSTYLNTVLEVDGGHLRHTNGQQGNKTIFFSFYDDTAAGLYHLPAGNVGGEFIQLRFGVPCYPTADSVVLRDHVYFENSAADGEMVAVIIVNVKEGVRQYTTCKLVAEGLFGPSSSATELKS